MAEKTSMWLIALAVGLFIIAFFLGISYYRSYRFGSGIGAVITRGMSGLSGTTVQLTCPAGKTISFENNNPTTTRGALVCSGNPTCDGFWSTSGQNSSFYNPTNTIDVMASGSPFTDLLSLEGQNSGSWNIPLPTDTRIPSSSCLSGCSGQGQQLQFIGTYDCV
jgi:hypothetical protein